MNINERWFKLFDQKITRLSQLIAVLESDDVPEGTFITTSKDEVNPTPQFDLISEGLVRHIRLNISGETDDD